jgi:hypothetical protein
MRRALALGCCLVALLTAHSASAQEAEVAERYSPASRSMRPAVARWRPLVAEYPWDVETALRIISCESEGDPDAVNPWSGAAGLFQAMPEWGRLTWRLFGSRNLLDPVVNTALAFLLWEDSGGRFSWHWGASVACWSGQ